MVLDDRAAQHLHAVVLVQELHPRVEAEHGRDDRQREVAGQRGVDARPDEVGEPQQRDVDVGPAAAEPADVALDLDRVLARSPDRGSVRGSMFSVNSAGSREDEP